MLRLVCLFLLATLPVAPAVAQVDSEQLAIDWTTNAADYRGQFRKAFNVYCPPAGRAATVWGVNIYTDDSSICTAAVHALATFDFARGGTVYFSMEPGQEGYDAERRRGVSTQNWDTFWDGGFRIVGGIPGKKQSELNDRTPIEITWATSARFLRGMVGAKRVVQCPRAGSAQRVWGSDFYTDDSSICAAAIHAGLITRDNGGGITLQWENGRENYTAATRNGVASEPWERWEGSFSLPRGQTVAALPVAPPIAEEAQPVRGPFAAGAPVMRATNRGPSGELLVNWNTSATEWRGQGIQRLSAYCPPGGRASTVWGTGLHTDDSSICTAAVHSLATFSFQSGGTVQFETADGRDSYASKERHGVSAESYGAWEASFRIISGVPGKRPQEISDNTELEISWTTTAQQLRTKPTSTRVRCSADGEAHALWGSGSYSANSSICTAAVHAGLITVAGGGVVSWMGGAPQQSFAAATRNGVTSFALNSAAPSFTLRK